ncbi:RNA polymerase sigma factor [Roseburia hominis]
MTDKLAVEQIKQGDYQALEFLINKYNHYISVILLNILGGLMEKEDVQEALNDVFLLLWRNIDKIDTQNYPDIKSYLAQIAKNTAKTKLRSLKQTLPLKEEILTNKDDEIERSNTREWLTSCIKQLGKPEQIVLVKYYYQGKSIKEISQEEQIPEATVKTRLRRGKAHLKSLLAKGE